MTEMQKAILVTEIGKPVQAGSRHIPTPNDGQVLVKIRATLLLPHDTYGRDWGLLIGEKLPAVLGSNVAGVIEQVGAGVSWKVGERVFGISSLYSGSSDSAGLQEYAVLEGDAVGRTPERFSDEEVVTLPINLVTSWAVLFTGAGFMIPPPFAHQRDNSSADNKIVIIGGGTNVGQFAVQLAHIAGISKIIVIAGASNNARLKSMGATHLIDRHASLAEITQQIQGIAGPDGITQVYNCAQLQVDVAIAALSSKRPSRLRVLLPINEKEEAELRMERPLCDASFMHDVGNKSLASHAGQFWRAVPQWLENRKLLPTEYGVVSGLHKVAEINSALDAYRDFTRTGPQTVVRVED